MIRVLAAALLLSGCSAALPDRCDMVWLQESTLRNCGERADTALWIKAMPELLTEFEEFYPGARVIAETFTVEIHDVEPDHPVGGLYMGYTEGDIIRLFIREGDGAEPRYSALAHEWIHMWEHKALGLTLDQWHALDTHFLEQEFAEAVLNELSDPARERILEIPL